jgi:hypothetical protein
MLKTIDHKIDSLKRYGIANLPENDMVETLVFKTVPYDANDMIDADYLVWETQKGGCFKLEED